MWLSTDVARGQDRARAGAGPRGAVARGPVIDNYGKALASAVLRFEVEIPEALVPLLRGQDRAGPTRV